MDHVHIKGKKFLNSYVYLLLESTDGLGKRLKLISSQQSHVSGMSPDSEKENEMMLDSGSDCVPMENSVNMDDDEEDEPYIDVVSEDSAIQEEEILEGSLLLR